MARVAVHLDSPFMGAHQAVHYGQPQPSALAHGLGGEEGFKNALLGGGIHARAVVLHRQGNVVVRLQVKALHQPQIGQGQAGANGDFSAGMHAVVNGMNGVVGQVEQGLLDLGRVGQHGGQIGRGINGQLNRRGQAHAQEFFAFLDGVPWVDGAAGGGLVAAKGENLPHQITGAAAGFFNFQQAVQKLRLVAAIGFGQFHVAQDCADDVVEVVRNAPGHGAQRLHFVCFAQLGFQGAALRFGALAAGQVAGKHGGAGPVRLKSDADLHRHPLATGCVGLHFAQQGLGGDVGQGQRGGHLGQKPRQGAAQGIFGAAGKQGRCRGVEDGDAHRLVHADDGIHRGVDHRLQPFFAGQQLGIALLQGAPFGQQRLLVDDGAHELRRGGAVLPGHFNAGNVQVALHGAAVAQVEDHFVHFAFALAAGQGEGLLHPVAVGGADKRHERGQQPVTALGLKGIERHGVGLDHHVVRIVQHQQRQRHAGKQGFKPLRGAFCHRLAVIEHLVLHLQLGLVVAQLGNQNGQGVVLGQLRGRFDGLERGEAGLLRQQRQGCVIAQAFLALDEKRQIRLAHGSSRAKRQVPGFTTAGAYWGSWPRLRVANGQQLTGKTLGRRLRPLMHRAVRGPSGAR